MKLGQRIMLLEKRRYLFRNWPKKPCRDILFPGCSFPSQFPRTMDALEQLCAAHDVGVAYDCCGKPLAEAGLEGDVLRVSGELDELLDGLGVARVIVLCPNCLTYLQETLSHPVVSIYERLPQWGISPSDRRWQGHYFIPCPDKKKQTLLSQIKTLCPLEQMTPVERAPCCGLRGDIAAHGPQAGQRLCALVNEEIGDQPLYTYCASCSGQFQRNGSRDVRHMLSELLGVHEHPDASRAFWNRVCTKWRKHK